MRFLKQSTAITILIGPFIDDTDGATPETGLDVTAIDCDLFKGVAKTDLSLTAAAGDNDSVHVSLGFYSLELIAGNTDTLGHLRIACDVAGAIPIYEDFHVLAANVYDSLFGAATVKLETDLIQIGSVAQSATDLKDFADAGYDPGTNKVQGVVLTDTCTTNTDMAGTDGAALASVCTEGRLAELDAGNLPTDIASLNDISPAEVNAEVSDVIDTDAGSELASVPGVTATLRKKIDALFQYFILKKTVTATTETMVKNDGATPLGTAALTDNGTTFTKDKMS